jgi:cyclic pyranopterin phosphate synthase
MAIDRFGRLIHYLRISLTDHCNLRCIYCMPEDISFRPIAELMQDDEIIRLVNLFVRLGFDKFRLTGGEPTVRAGIVDLVRQIHQIEGVRALSMTTNGVLFSSLAEPLKRAGLQRVNFSLDTLDPEKFRKLTRRGSLADVWAGIQAAEAAGLLPIKVNAVVARGYSDAELVDMARLTLEHAWQVRFIELMPFAGATDFQTSQVISADEMMRHIETVLGPLLPVDGGRLDGEARLFRLEGSLGNIGFINTITQPFCASCTRARLTADGRLRLCLLCEDEVDLITPLRSGATDDELRQVILDGIWQKPWGNRLREGQIPLNRVMSEIGG